MTPEVMYVCVCVCVCVCMCMCVCVYVCVCVRRTIDMEFAYKGGVLELWEHTLATY